MTRTARRCTDATMAKAQEVDAVLLGAVGGPKYDARLSP
jgi:isocitrate/isopropylmalate dehydrogenase